MPSRTNQRSQRPPAPSSLRRLSALPRGPRYLRLQSDPRNVTDWLPPPQGFVTASTSASEWMFYKAAAIATGTPRHPEKPPYLGGDYWTYQRPFDKGRGGAIIDFVFYTTEGRLAVRIQTYAFHLKTDARKQAYDRVQAQYLGRFFKLVDVNEEDLIRDPSGQQATQTVKALLSGYVFLDPLKAGTVLDVR